MKVNDYSSAMKETIHYMKEMNISEGDRRELIEDCYGCIGKLSGFPLILREKAMEIYENSPLTGEHAKNTLEKSINNEASKILINQQQDDFYYDGGLL